MNETYPIFIANRPDDNHCLQAAMLSVLNSLGHRTVWEEIEERTEYEPALYTWSVCGAAVLAQQIPGTKLLSAWDYARFVAEGEEYLKEVWSPDWVALQRARASPNFAKERAWAERAIKLGVLENRKIGATDVIGALKQNIVIALVNACALRNLPGISGHFVVVFGSNEKNVFIHDPGLPPYEGLRVSKEAFTKAFNKDAIFAPHPNFVFGMQKPSQGTCYCPSGKRFRDCHGQDAA